MPIKSLTAAELFAEQDAIEVDRDRAGYLLRGHLDPDQVARIIAEFNNPDGPRDDIAPIPGAIKATWTVIAKHEPDCTANEPDTDPDGTGVTLGEFDLCDCEARTDDRPRDYLYAESASEGTPGALPVTWVLVYYPGLEFLPDYSVPEAAAECVDELRGNGWFDDAVTPEPVPGEPLLRNSAV